MNRLIRPGHCALWFLLLAVAALDAADLAYLQQGWTDAERQHYYYLPQGSEIMPHAWFMALEQPGSDQPFRDPGYMASFRYLPNAASRTNPDGLPVGFTKGKGRGGQDWFGMSCAACHTGQLSFRGQTVRVDGGATLADIIGFQSALVSALRATLEQPEKFRRFAARVLGANPPAKKLRRLQRKARENLAEMELWERTNRPAYPTGFGNWDALNVLMNCINGTALGIRSNYRRPLAPASYPSIWLTTQTDKMAWNASVENPTLRSIGEVIIVFGRALVARTAKGFHFGSSAELPALQQLYDVVGRLKPPRWPEQVLGRIDPDKARRGERIYEREQCTRCHGNKPPYAMTAPTGSGYPLIRVTPTPIEEVGTDPVYARSFVARTATPGIMAPAFQGSAIENQAVIPGALLFLGTLTAITQAEVAAAASTPQEQDAILAHRPLPTMPKTKSELDQLVKSLLVYKAAPLAGIWSTAPYLHNASVPNLYELLLPAERRAKSFYLGSYEFDPSRVGYRTEPFEGGHRFDTSLPGYSNQGHAYGTQLSDEERWALLEYLKTL